MNYYQDEPEWKWLFKNAINWKEILPLYYPSYPTEDGLESEQEVIEFLEELYSNTGAWAGTSVNDRAEELDHVGAGEVKDGKTIPSAPLNQFVKEATELGFFGLALPREYGGLETPVSLYFLALGQLSRSCMSSSTLAAFYASIAEMTHRYCDKETAARIIPQIISGTLSGSMNLTEPGCGSDLGMISTSAAKQEDGTYLINGSKIFITNGGGGVGFVLARIKGAKEGLAGLSMFFVEQHPGGDESKLNFKVAKNEHKMGMHGSFTTEIVYENSVGHLVGEEHQGFKYMLHLMNEARLCVGAQALGGIEGSLDYAIKYATERKQFGKPLTELPLMKRNLHDLTTERDAIRALIVDTMSNFDVYFKLDSKKWHTNDLTEAEQKLLKRVSRVTRKRTPLVKYYACEALTTFSQKAIQILGGYGFMKEYPVERHHRDSFGPLLYEGTSQIQALMALKDLMKDVLRNPKNFLTDLVSSHPSTSLLKGKKSWESDLTKQNYKFQKNLTKLIVKTLKPESGLLNPKNWQSEESIDKLMIHAETICQAISYLETLEVLSSHATIDESRSKLFNDYLNLIRPRFQAIYTDWDIRS